ncbi:Hpt domain-containing protein [Desulfonatronovibrio magnus]|uniref:Hpt domain-containing protein n=1 Tax=Desulfonatronovibrio magnus TaxID=698827 RepID=UPI000A010FBF|nr:Hpt domain-containing protein [Desulfonatronovibrio magnus]
MDAKAVHEYSYALKGSAATVGAKDLAAVLQEIEVAGKSGELAGLERLLPQAEQELERLRSVVDGGER